METTHLRNISDSFPSGLNRSFLKSTINHSENIGPQLRILSIQDGVVSFVFEDALDAAELTELDNIIAAHVPGTLLNSVGSVASGFPALNLSDSFQELGRFLCTGTNGTRYRLLMTASGSAASYTLRVRNLTQNQILVSDDFMVSDAVISTGVFSEVPFPQEIICIEARIPALETCNLQIHSVISLEVL